MSPHVQPLFTSCPLVFPPPSTASSPHGHDHGQSLFVTSPISATPPFDETEELKHARSSQPSSRYNSILPSPVFEALSFNKIPVPSSTTASTDSEAFSSDWAGPTESKRSSIQSPSLISCLFQSTAIVAKDQQFSNNNQKSFSGHSQSHTQYQGRSSSGEGSNRPILRRDTMSTSASEDNLGAFGLGINKLNLEDHDGIGNGRCPPVIRKRPSILTFAVSSPRAGPSRPPSRSTSTSASPTSSYACGRLPRSPCVRPNWGKIRGQVEKEIQEDDEQDNEDNEEDDDEDEDEDENEDYIVDSPLPIPGHDSDEEDAGYMEDEEDGDTSEEDDDDDAINHGADRIFAGPSRSRTTSDWNNNVIEWNKDYLATPKRRSTTIPQQQPLLNYMTSTDDCFDNDNQPMPVRGRKTSIAINENTKPSSNRCTRHRSPPPPIRLKASSIQVPPAARSPSAFDLCRRRDSGSVEVAARKGWKSDDYAFFPNPNRHKASSLALGCQKEKGTNQFKLPSASTSTATSASASASASRESITPQTGGASGNRKNSLPTPKLDGRCHSTRSILKRNATSSNIHNYEPQSTPMIRSSGEIAKIPPKTPPLDNHSIPLTGAGVNLLRRGSAPAKSIQQQAQKACANGLLDIGIGPGNTKPCIARSATGYEEEEMGYHKDRGLRIY
ncbi:uncharacterized protein I303_107471 [Kwoniella dejecticola CBS 10117]|uniref:Uncharacterized protein n=1 Tax=Kwoniella dejecticola CBS 10117 TaxID=1296121 RepID=A0A1A5ZZS1_9TREE|nr:uncharacterized protein I303_06876 [Kwoniella dejecticola CBS 10117]OBR83311.1 hypothetical protein I303_06876 [Kwoniella dejecticola CBS 10117]